MSLVEFTPHDHDNCIAHGLTVARAVCEQSNLHLTPVRECVLTILLQQHRAMGAYDVLDVLKQKGYADQPPVAYRALKFLVNAGLAHKIERLNAFVACAHIGKPHVPAFLICRSCLRISETSTSASQGDMLSKLAPQTDFVAEHTFIEAEGKCMSCLNK